MTSCDVRKAARLASVSLLFLTTCDADDDARTCADWLRCYDACRYAGGDWNDCAYAACEPGDVLGLVFPVYDADTRLAEQATTDCADAFAAAEQARAACYAASD